MRAAAVFFALINLMMVIASVMDLKEKKVYDLVWIVCITASAFFIITERSLMLLDLPGLLLYVIVQEFAMGKVYGRADSHAFTSCAFYFAGFGRTIDVYVFHLSVTFIMISAVQMIKKNTDKRGKLLEPVAMVPYITVGAWVTSAVFLR